MTTIIEEVHNTLAEISNLATPPKRWQNVYRSDKNELWRRCDCGAFETCDAGQEWRSPHCKPYPSRDVALTVHAQDKPQLDRLDIYLVRTEPLPE